MRKKSNVMYSLMYHWQLCTAWRIHMMSRYAPFMHHSCIHAPIGQNVVRLATSTALQATLRQLLALGRTAPTACGDTALPRFSLLRQRRTQYMNTTMLNYVEVSWNDGTPKSSTLMGFPLINHAFWDTPIYGNPHIELFLWNRFRTPRSALPDILRWGRDRAFFGMMA